jgi:1-acyl-sn-glycerol-3-phosphate acyltransferase
MRDALARPFFEVFRTLSMIGFRIGGWRFEGEIPSADKFLVIAAPHTTNWDLPIMLGIATHFRRRLFWVGKRGLFKPPFGWFMRLLGGVPVKRSGGDNAVDAMVAQFKARERFVLGVLPEGTRKRVSEWKSGFYHMAQGADVPIVFGFVDYARKVAGVGGVMTPSGDYEADLQRIKRFYANVTGKHPERA